MLHKELFNLLGIGRGADFREPFKEGKKFFIAGLNAGPDKLGTEFFAKATVYFTEAIEKFEKWSPKGIKSIYGDPYLYRGFIYYQVGKKKEAIEDLKKTIEALELYKP